MNRSKTELLKELEDIDKQIQNKNKSLIKLLKVVKCTDVNWYTVNNDVQYLQDRKNNILFELTNK